MRLINDAKSDYDRKHAPKKQVSEEERQKERERIKKAADEEFLAQTSNYDKQDKKSKKKEDFTVADILGLDEFEPIVPEENKPEEKAVEPAAEAKAEQADEPEVAPAASVSSTASINSVLEAAPEADVSVLGEEEKAPEVPASDSFDEIVIPDISDLPEAQAVENPGFIPSETIEEIGVVEITEDKIQEPKIVVTHKSETPKQPEPIPEAPGSEPEQEVKAERPEKIADIPTPKAGEKMSLEDFQTAVKKLKSMHDSGLLTDEEFSEEKSKLMKFLY